MSRRRKRGSVIGPLIMLIVVGGAVYYLANPSKISWPTSWSKISWPSWLDVGKWLPADKATSTVKVVETAKPPEPATQLVLLGAATPAAKSDRLFSLLMPAGEIKESTVADGWRATQLLKGDLKIADQNKSDGAMFLKGGKWSVPLRNAKGTPYEQVTLLGMFDADHAALIGRLDDRWLLSVSKNNEIREVAVLSDNLDALAAGQNAAWLSTFMPGEGIESPPRGPSNLIKISRDGSTNSLLTEPDVIVQVVAGPGTSYAYQTEDGRLHAVAGDRDLRRDGRPLLWLDEKNLLFSQGVTVYQWNATDGSTKKIGDLAVSPMTAVLSNPAL